MRKILLNFICTLRLLQYHTKYHQINRRHFSASLLLYYIVLYFIVKIKKINSELKNIAGVKVNILSNIDFAIENVSLFNMPSWIRLAISMFERLMTIQVKIEMTEARLNALAYARKKTTQKVNLYEKVQIPEYKTAIIKIKRYMEDEDNLSKSSQKIVKERNRAKEASL